MARAQLRVLILGATSGIAAATARLYAAEGASLLLVARNAEATAGLAKEMMALGAASCETACLDLAATAGADALAALVDRLGGVDHIHIAYAIMPEQALAASDLSVAADVIGTNYTSAAIWALTSANLLERLE